MVWQGRRKFYEPRMIDLKKSPSKFGTNDSCFMRKNHRCGKIFGASKSCFIACPSMDEINPILDLISEKLMKVGIEPIVAVRERAYGQDIFCTKICGKIIESNFCIVILDDFIKDETNIPNPNVYYEYGLMTALNKHIIPLQKESLKLAFNIQSYDTIKYGPKNIGGELDRAIKDAVKVAESGEEEDVKTDIITDKKTMRCLELAGYDIKDDRWFLSDIINDTDYRGFGNNRHYLYLGKADSLEDMQYYCEDASIVMYRTEKVANRLNSELNNKREELKNIEEEEERLVRPRLRFHGKDEVCSEIRDLENKLELMKTVYLGWICSSKVDIKSSIEFIKKEMEKYPRFKIADFQNNMLIIGSDKVPLLSTGI